MSLQLRANTLALFLLFIASTRLPAADDPGLRVAPGFKVSLYADQDLANDIFAMTLDSKGRVVVTSTGWIKVLHDTTGTGKADKATVFAETRTGGMGMCFDGNDLLFCGDGWLMRYRDPDGTGRAQGPPEKLLPLAFGEHGGHAMRKGPDGYWYIIGGNDTGIKSETHATLPNSLVRKPEAGAILRLSPDFKQCEVIAHGFRNPYDFDFNAVGDLFTYDSDTERDIFLPWYGPTRVYHVEPGGHHGWRLPGYMRSWWRPDDYPDNVNVLWPVGRGSPTGVVCYRHNQFPEHYRGGIFALDWTFGKVYFLPLTPDGASYKTRAEVFLEATGTSGFAPTDVCVAPDGSLFLCIGGRKTRGAVYKIEYVGDGKEAVNRTPKRARNLNDVLRMPQPLDAWSRALWEPVGKKLSPEALAMAAVYGRRDSGERIRCIEILTEQCGSIWGYDAEKFVEDKDPLVRARAAWSLGRRPLPGENRGVNGLLVRLAQDADARVRHAALIALAEDSAGLKTEAIRKAITANLAHDDRRVRQATARLAALLPQESWEELWYKTQLPPRNRLTLTLALLWREPYLEMMDHAVDAILPALQKADDPQLLLEGLRLLVLALGDWRMQDPPIDPFTGYMVSRSLDGRDKLVRRILAVVRPLFPAKDERVSEEAARLLAILADDDPTVIAKVAAFWSKTSSATRDVHYLVVLARLRGAWPAGLATQVADTLLSLDRKLEGQQQRHKQNWGVRLAEITTYLLKHEPALTDALLAHPEFVKAANVSLTTCLPAEQRRRAARLFLAAVQKDAEFAWSGPLLDLFQLLPDADVRPVLRRQWDDFGLHDALLLRLADPPEAADREKFLAGLESPQGHVVRACLKALGRLPRDEAPQHLVPLLALLRRLQREPKETALRAEALALVARQSGQSFTIKEDGADAAALKRAYQPVFAWFEKEQPKLAQQVYGVNSEDEAKWKDLLGRVDWDKGDVRRGEVLFRNRACVTCHTGTTRIGPDLNGVAGRFSRDDLFTAIIYPSRDVAPTYRVTVVETRGGQVYSGIVVFESADGVILQTSATETVRVATGDIASRQLSSKSLMPDGLLKDLKPDDLADLYSYLQTLKAAK